MVGVSTALEVGGLPGASPRGRVSRLSLGADAEFRTSPNIPHRLSHSTSPPVVPQPHSARRGRRTLLITYLPSYIPFPFSPPFLLSNHTNSGNDTGGNGRSASSSRDESARRTATHEGIHHLIRRGIGRAVHEALHGLPVRRRVEVGSASGAAPGSA